MALKEVSTSPTLSEAFFQSVIQEIGGEKFLACLQCGTCGGSCPFGYWMDFTPRLIIHSMRAGMFDDVVNTDSVWMCVSCYACAEQCPAEIPLTAILMTRAKEELVLAGNVPEELQAAFESSQRYHNPLGESRRKRAAWTEGIDPAVTLMAEADKKVDVLWFVGDYGAYHPRVIEISKAMVKIFNALGIKFGILGNEESSDGDSQRLAGEPGIFEKMAEENGKVFGKYKFKEIVTMDPHAYNAFKNEYPRLGIEYPVKHYTEFLVEKMKKLKPLLKNEISALVAYHDPCYLGRVNDIYEEPRALLEAIPGVELVEMSHNRAHSLCCGGGGGGMWLDGFQWEISKNRLSEWRVKEAVEAYPEHAFVTAFDQKEKKKKSKPKATKEAPTQRILAVACPYETPRFEDATKVVKKAEKLIVKDIAELLVESMGI